MNSEHQSPAKDTETLRTRLQEFAARVEQPDVERYEANAEQFYRDTGYLAPGQSVPLAMADGSYDDRRDALWKAWVAQRKKDYITTLHAAADALNVPPQPWMQIDTAPKDGRRILVYGVEFRRHSYGIGYYWRGVPGDGEGWVAHVIYSAPDDDFRGAMHNLTHWMPLPTPPPQETPGV